MSEERTGSAPVGLGLRAIKGGAAAVCVGVERGKPRVVLSTFLATSAEGDRLSFEPYGVASELKRNPTGKAPVEAAAIVADGRRRQEQMAAKGLHAIVGALEAARCRLAVAALLVNRAAWVTDLLQYSAAFPEHVRVAEGLAVREALRFALHERGVDVTELDEKSLPDVAANELDMSSMAIGARLKELGAAVPGPWRKEQKMACLSAWFAITIQR